MLKQLHYESAPVMNFIANYSEPEYGEVEIIKRFNGMLVVLDFDCFFPHSYPLSSWYVHYYNTKKNFPATDLIV